MHGVYALQHVISLVDWPKHVKFFFVSNGSLIDRHDAQAFFPCIRRSWLSLFGSHDVHHSLVDSAAKDKYLTCCIVSADYETAIFA